MSWLISIATVVSLITFVGIAIWAWSKGRAPANDASAQLPFDLPDESTTAASRKDRNHE